MLPDLETLRCFDAAATHPSFRAAAKAVGLSPPAFGERIKSLEALCGEALFTRTTRKVMLTPAGQRLRGPAREALESARRCLEAVHHDRPLPFELSVGTRFELGLSWLTPSLAKLQRACPERTLHLVFGDSPELLEKTRAGHIDATVTSYRLAHPGISYAVLHEEQYAFVMSPSLARARAFRRPRDASAHTLLDISRELPLFRYLLDSVRVRASEPWTFARVELLGTIGAIRMRALEGAGVAVLPRYLVAPDLARGRLVEPLPRLRLRSDFFRLVWREGHPRERELTALAESLRELPLR